MNYCPCCSYVLSRHIRGGEIHWFCRHCWQDMPLFSNAKDTWVSTLAKLESSRVVSNQPELTAA